MKKLLAFLGIAALVFVFAGCSSNTTNDTTTTDTSTEMTTTDTTNNNKVIGEWQYSGTIDGKYYEVSLDLENSGLFSLDIDEETTDETIDSEAKGTYTYDNDTITLSIATVQDLNGYFTNAVVENSQLEFNYELSNNDNNLTLTNVSEAVTLLPNDLTLVKDY